MELIFLIPIFQQQQEHQQNVKELTLRDFILSVKKIKMRLFIHQIDLF
jgi:hypothetical protein